MRGEITYLGLTIPFERGSYEFYRNLKWNGRPATQVLFRGFDFYMTANEKYTSFFRTPARRE